MQKKFIIYGQSRSGSTLLVELMNESADIHCDGELLNAKAGYLQSKRMLKLINKYPFPYFNYMRRRAEQGIYGFKLLFYQVRFPRYVLNRLSRSGWKIVHVRRRNVFHQSFSKIIATKTDHWHRRVGDDDPDYQVNIGIEELEFELKRRENWIARELDLISGIDHLDLTYEDNLQEESAWLSTIEKVSTYLGIEPFQPGRSNLKRTDDRPYSEIISNYAEVRDYLQISN